jgi:SHS2 domain-containing protein
MRPVSRTEEHVGEWKVSLRADTLEELFREAARVVSRSCEGARDEGPRAVGGWETISLAARDAASLLADWMNELLGRSEVNRRKYDEIGRLHIADGTLEGEVRGSRVEEWRSPLKAATYHDLTLEQRGGRWHAVVLLDV